MMRRFNRAFTMIELVFVIVVIGILAILAIPRLDRDLREEAQTNILNAIRYTQHLALMDDKQMFDNPKWQQRYWQIAFNECASGSNNFFYKIGSDNNMGGGGQFSKAESAIDGATGLPYFWPAGTDCSKGGDGTVSSNIFISKKYGINSVTFSGGCAGAKYVGFDNLGRPHVHFGGSSSPDNSSYMSSDCKITFSFKDSSINPFTVTITKETGYAYTN
jgi:prepilin-type N-terminal cleavage/methylation domain-containing protein